MACGIAAIGVALGIGIGITPASAHPYLSPVQIPVGRPVALALLVDSHFAADTKSVVIEIPSGFEVSGASAPTGWTVTTGAADIHFTGDIAPGRSVVMTVRGMAPKKASLVFPMTVSSTTGESTRYEGGCLTTSPNKGGLVYAGIDPAKACDDLGGASGPAVRTSGVAIALAGLAVGAVTVVIKRRR